MEAYVGLSAASANVSVNTANGHTASEDVIDVLESISNKGVRIWVEKGRLHYKAPKGALTQADIRKLRTFGFRIVAYLCETTDSGGVDSMQRSGARVRRAPLTFSQLARWHRFRLGECCSVRQIAAAMRLSGRLRVDALRQSLSDIVQRHDALRTRIVIVDGSPIQEIDDTRDCQLPIADLTRLSGGLREAEVQREIEKFIMEPIDVAVDLLFGVRLLKLNDDEHILMVAMEHSVSDLFSLNVLWRDLLSTYTSVVKGRPSALPRVPVQFADYAVWQRNTERLMIGRHGAFWNEQLAGCRLTFPENKSEDSSTQRGWGSVPVRIDRNLKAELYKWCRVRQTTPVLAALTAYFGLVSRWCKTTQVMIECQSDGRVSPQLEEAIGLFASPIYLSIRLHENDSFVALKNRVTEEYCRAHEHADFSYMAAQMPPSVLTRVIAFNWIPQGTKSNCHELQGSEDAISCCPIAFEHPALRKLELDREPVLVLFDADEEVVGGVRFPLNRYSIDSMERFGRNFLVFIEALLGRAEECVSDIVLSQ